jgi:hypothetical protein
VRYDALLSNQAPAFSLAKAKEIHSNLYTICIWSVKRKFLATTVTSNRPPKATTVLEPMPVSTTAYKTVGEVYTDSNDPMELSHPEARLTSSAFELTQDPAIMYSSESWFGPDEMQPAPLDIRPNMVPGGVYGTTV